MKLMRCMAVVVLGLPQLVAAHGVAPTGKTRDPRGALDRFWEVIISPARAAANMRLTTEYRFVSADGMPDHATGQFPNRDNPNAISRQSYEFRMPVQPQRASSLTELRRNQLFGVAVNGVVFDPWTAEFWNNDRRYTYEAMTGPYPLGLDRNNAHVQPDGSYHYHALPVGLYERLATRNVPALLGYSADGFPIYGPMGYRNARDAGSGMVELRSGYRLKSGTRDFGPGGAHKGEFAQDYEFVPGGDLDNCNGREGVTPEYPNGIYHYVITTAFPYVPRCYVGSPDGSFTKQPPLFGPGGGGKGGPKGPPKGPPKGEFDRKPPPF
jgi:hypothetical protein